GLHQVLLLRASDRVRLVRSLLLRSRRALDVSEGVPVGRTVGEDDERAEEAVAVEGLKAESLTREAAQERHVRQEEKRMEGDVLRHDLVRLGAAVEPHRVAPAVREMEGDDPLGGVVAVEEGVLAGAGRAGGAGHGGHGAVVVSGPGRRRATVVWKTGWRRSRTVTTTPRFSRSMSARPRRAFRRDGYASASRSNASSVRRSTVSASCARRNRGRSADGRGSRRAPGSA